MIRRLHLQPTDCSVGGAAMAVFFKIVARTSFALYLVAIVAILVMMVNICADVVATAFFRKPIHGTLEFTTNYYMPIIATLPIAIAQLRNQHITVELLAQSLSPKGSAILFLFDALIVVPYLAAFFWFSFLDAIKKTRIGEFIFAIKFDLPVWPSRWVIPAGYFVLTLCIVWQVMRTVGYLRSGDTGRPPNEVDHTTFTI